MCCETHTLNEVPFEYRVYTAALPNIVGAFRPIKLRETPRKTFDQIFYYNKRHTLRLFFKIDDDPK